MSTIEAWVATYPGGHKYLDETLESLKDQTVPVAVHVLDDERLPHDKWNEAIEKCTSDYLALPHHDDVYLPRWAEELSNYLDAHPEVVAVFSLDYLINEDGKRVGQTYGSWEAQDTYSYKDLIGMYGRLGNALRCETVMFNRKVLGDMRSPDRSISGTAHDTQFWFELAAKHPIGIVMKPLVKYRIHPESDTQLNVVPDLTRQLKASYKDVIQSGHLEAMAHAISLRPQDVEFDLVMFIAKATAEKKERIKAEKIQARTGPSELYVCHEPPDAAGVGMVVANTVRTRNDMDDGRVRYYIYPVPGDKVEVVWSNGLPLVKCPVEAFGDVIERLKPAKVEFHHLLKWPLDILNAPCPQKELWLHDSFLWCARYHSVNKDGVVCNEPDHGKKCADCSGESVEFLKKKNAFLAEALPRLNRFVANSEYTAKYAYVNFGITCEVIAPAGAALAPSTPKKRVGYFGGFGVVKGTPVLLKAMRMLKDALLLMFCDVPADWLKGRKPFGFDNVLVVGSYHRSDLPDLCNLVDLAVVPSLNESYGLVKRELEALGCKVVATRTGGMDGEIEPGDAEALAEAIRTAL